MLRVVGAVLVAIAVLAVESEAQRREGRDSARFVASSRGQVYYWIGCDAWKRLDPSNLRYFFSAADAEAAGYKASASRGCAPQLETAPIVPTVGGQAACKVSRIVDGDTFQCEGGSRFRMLLVDADELNQSVHADSAVLLLGRWMGVGTSIQLEFDVQLHDRYDRILAYVHANGLFVNRELVRHGLARVAIDPPNVRELEQIRAAADSARQERLGVWAGSALQCAPAEYRAGTCR